MTNPSAGNTSATALLLKNGRIIDPKNGRDETGDLLVEHGKIAGFFPSGQAPKSDGMKSFDLTGKWILPGLIDMHVHLREPGEEYKETIMSGTRAAAAGGFTAVACMPNTNPVNDNQAITSLILDKAEKGYARVYPIGCISKGGKGKMLAEFGEMKEAGVVALSDDGRPVANSQLMRRALEYAGNYNLLVICHSEELALSENGAMNEGALSTKLGLRGIPRSAEEIMVYRDLSLAEYTGKPIHIAHVSTRESVSLIRRAKEKGSPVTAESAPHYFSLTEKAIDSYNTLAKMNPPLRTTDDLLAIREGLHDGSLDVIATDHAPHSMLEKDVEFDRAANGIIGLETAVPLAMELVRDNVLDVARMVELLSVNPAKILGVAGGSLSKGAAADITVIDPEREFIYSADMVVSKSGNSPFLDRKFKGKAVLTILGGRITFSELDS
ncbi:MAG: dihydroorotase [Desulfobulbaceae bacterium]|nr:dihydroorotase [Desulfobulbaceae bacterium]